MDNQVFTKLFEDIIEDPSNLHMKADLLALSKGEDKIELAKELTDENSNEASSSEGNLASKVRDMSIPEKIKLAIHGNQSARALLIRDNNKQIPQFVLGNAKITEGEILEFAKNNNLDEMVLRTIANNATWTRNYSIKLALICNPKTPIGISLRWLKLLQDKDLRLLSKSKNIPQVIPTQCRKLLEMRANK